MISAESSGLLSIQLRDPRLLIVLQASSSLVFANSLCAVPVSPPFTLSPANFFSPSVISCGAYDVIGSPACCCALAVGPLLTEPSWPVSSFSFAVIFEIVFGTQHSRARALSTTTDTTPPAFSILYATLVGPPRIGWSCSMVFCSPMVMS